MHKTFAIYSMVVYTVTLFCNRPVCLFRGTTTASGFPRLQYPEVLAAPQIGSTLYGPYVMQFQRLCLFIGAPRLRNSVCYSDI